jgi:phage tail sheath protein FI
MANDFLHGVESLVVNNPTTPIKLLKASVIGLVATADDADATTFPLLKAVMVDSKKVVDVSPEHPNGLAGSTGTLSTALKDINSQAKRTLVVVVRVAEGADQAETDANALDGIDQLIYAESLTGVRPRLLIAPGGFTQEPVIGAKLESIAAKLRAIPIIDGNEGDLATVDGMRSAYQKAYFVNPGIEVGGVTRPASAVVAGHVVRCDKAFGFHQSPSNQKIYEITGTSQPVDHVLGSVDSLSNLYSEKNITTIVRQNGGWFLWGNNLADGVLITHERIRQIVADSILLAHQQYVDKNIDADLVTTILTKINNFIRALVKNKVIASGRVWYDPELNDDAALANRRMYFDYEMAFFSVGERVTMRQHTRLATTGEIFNVA